MSLETLIQSICDFCVYFILFNKAMEWSAKKYIYIAELHISESEWDYIQGTQDVTFQSQACYSPN